MTWKPLITDPAEQARLRGIAGEIAAAVAAWPEPRTNDQLTDHALLRAYLGSDDGGEEDVGGEALSDAVVGLGTARTGPGLHGGAARVGWTVAHLTEGDDADAVGNAVESSIAALLEAPTWSEYDLVSGLVGFGVFALERGEGRGPLAVRVLDHLERLASPHLAGLGWFSAPAMLPGWQRELCPEGYWNLGLAHGSPGVIGLLARYLATGIEPDRAGALLESAVTNLIALARDDGNGRFLAWLAPVTSEEPQTVRRVAWCYGDLGVAAALFAAADATGNAAWRDEALTTARAAASSSVERSGVVDACLCHGAAGAAHIFNRFHQASGDPALGDAARVWVERLVAMRTAEDVAGFPSGFYEDAAFRWQPDVTLLNGAPGVALVLHAACSDVEPLWDRLMLVDLAC